MLCHLWSTWNAGIGTIHLPHSAGPHSPRSFLPMFHVERRDWNERLKSNVIYIMPTKCFFCLVPLYLISNFEKFINILCMLTSIYMKTYIVILALVLSIVGCNKNDNIKEISFESGYQPYFSGTKLICKIDLSCGIEQFPVFTRELSPKELDLFLSDAKQFYFNNEDLVAVFIKVGNQVELIGEIDDYYKINLGFLKGNQEGFLLKEYCGNLTIKCSVEPQYSMNSFNSITNPELLPYCRILIAEKFHNLLKEGKDKKNPEQHLNNILDQTGTELLLFSIFVGERRREISHDPERGGSGNSYDFYSIRNEYYMYNFCNYFNMFVALNPNIPQKIDSVNFYGDTVKMTVSGQYSLQLNQETSFIILYPKDKRTAIANQNGDVWILNDSISMIDISYLTNQINVSESEKGHIYFYEILELYIQSVLPKRKTKYLEQYFSSSFQQ